MQQNPHIVPTVTPTDPAADAEDEFLWLEDIHGERPLDWVREQDARTEALLGSEGFEELQRDLTAILDSPDRIPHVTKRGDWYYNFWRDGEHPRGLWRRTRWEPYLAGDPQWDVLVDVDALAAQEGTDWVFAGARLLRPDWDRALLRLSPDGGDAVAVREFDLTTRAFVPAPEGFDLPVAKTQASWIDRDRLLVGTVTDPDPDAGDATRSSYARTLRVLQRGGPEAAIAAAPTVFEVDPAHVAAFGGHDSTPGWERTVAIDAVDFYRSTTWLREPAAPDSADGPGDRSGWRQLEVPLDAEVDVHRQWLTVFLKSEWELPTAVHPAGSLLVCTVDGFLDGSEEPRAAFLPSPDRTLSAWTWTAAHLVLTVLQDVASTVYALPQTALAAADPRGTPQTTAGRPPALEATRLIRLEHPNPADPFLTLGVSAVDDEDPDCGNDLWITATGALTPPTLLRATLPADWADLEENSRPDDVVPALVTVRTGPEQFDATGLAVRQHFAVSDDGTRVPYFQIGPEDVEADGANPVVMDGYGGFLASKLPGYSGVYGRGWLSRRNAAGRQGIHVIANIRGGGEYGPDWHRAALQENRHRAYEDFAAVARDLIRRGVTDRSHLAATGRSNGGLLMGNMATTYPELFGALSCGVPLLDMRRYTVLSAGHSWIAEYGDPEDPEQWEYLRTFSPYHLLLERPIPGAEAGRDAEGPGTGYPDLLVWTATSDDRVGPVQARKMAARMMRLGVPNVWFHEDLEGGHAGASDNRQAAALHARSLEFLWRSVADDSL
ncbi:prolyl oligopeptidase family serine peptidase [Citricoccus sp.]|uniref:prolyl oligopeptidase family serine peptidase n=1 Tax=Citricoccus sp. TaxID=1978372 RepID=UPI0028BD3CC0|nr:prolyl oligopeptidase family serine peptidase [Citricoccus sp.]